MVHTRSDLGEVEEWEMEFAVIVAGIHGEEDESKAAAQEGRKEGL